MDSAPRSSPLLVRADALTQAISIRRAFAIGTGSGICWIPSDRQSQRRSCRTLSPPFAPVSRNIDPFACQSRANFALCEQTATCGHQQTHQTAACFLKPTALFLPYARKSHLSLRPDCGTRLHLWRYRDGGQYRLAVADPFGDRWHSPSLIGSFVHPSSHQPNAILADSTRDVASALIDAAQPRGSIERFP